MFSSDVTHQNKHRMGYIFVLMLFLTPYLVIFMLKSLFELENIRHLKILQLNLVVKM